MSVPSVRPRRLLGPILVVLVSLLFSTASAAPPAQEPLPQPILPYDAQLTLANGAVAPDGPYTFQFVLFAQPEGGTPLWSEAHTDVAVLDGRVSLQLGAITPIPRVDDGQLWLEVSLRGPGEAAFTTLAPRDPVNGKEITVATGASPDAPDALSCDHTHLFELWSGSSPTYGLIVRNNSTGDGIRGYTTATSPAYAGLYGANLGGGGGSGVYGYSSAGIGVRGGSSSGRAVVGNSQFNDGVVGTSGGTSKSGVYGEHSAAGYGVFGRSATGQGMGATGGGDASGVDQVGDLLLGGVRGELLAAGDRLNLSSNGDIWLILDRNNNDTNACVYGYNSAGGSTAIWCENGAKSAIIQTESYGSRALYVIESPEVWLDDLGSAQLVNGSVVVPFDPVFAQMINAQVPYHVQVTPLGESAGLYVAEKRADGFVVREVGGGTSNVAFDWRVSAKRLGLEDLRSEVFDASVMEP
jgi:hypothetical protein